MTPSKKKTIGAPESAKALGAVTAKAQELGLKGAGVERVINSVIEETAARIVGRNEKMTALKKANKEDTKTIFDEMVKTVIKVYHMEDGKHRVKRQTTDKVSIEDAPDYKAS